ncbi:MAG: SLC13 family permease, partial [Gemmatimonadota bacterium]
MTTSLALLLLLLLAFLLASAREWVPMELGALGLVVALALTGILTPDEAIAGFANPVVIAIAGLFVINAAVERSGLIDWLGARLAAVALRSPRGALTLLLGATGFASMLVSNVATVALLTPAVVAASRRAKVSPSRFLMPLAFISLVGGMATLIGATGNLIVQGMAVEAGARPFAFFEFAYVGLPLLGLSMLYLVTVGWSAVPRRRPESDAIAGPLRDYLVEVVVADGSALVGRTLADARLRERFGLTLLAVRRGDRRIVSPGPDTRLAAGDRLIVEGGADDVAAATASGELATDHDDADIRAEDLESDRINLYEVLVPPR